MNKIEIRIWNNYEFNKTAWIQIFNCTLTEIWDYINKLKINKNRINAFWVKLHEFGFDYNIEYKIKNYKRFINNLIKKFKRLEINCNISIIDMDEEKEYEVGTYKPFLPPLHCQKYDKKSIKYKKILKGAQPKTDAGPKPDPKLISYIGYTSREKEKTKLISADFVKGYLDGYIMKWREILKNSKTKDDKLIAKCNIDTYQSVRVSILGETLAENNEYR